MSPRHCPRTRLALAQDTATVTAKAAALPGIASVTPPIAGRPGASVTLQVAALPGTTTVKAAAPGAASVTPRVAGLSGFPLPRLPTHRAEAVITSG